jgi:hypothetical protein
MSVMLVKFIQDHPRENGTDEVFRKGHIYELPEGSAFFWLRRGIADTVSPEEQAQLTTRAEPAQRKVASNAKSA